MQSRKKSSSSSSSSSLRQRRSNSPQQQKSSSSSSLTSSSRSNGISKAQEEQEEMEMESLLLHKKGNGSSISKTTITTNGLHKDKKRKTTTMAIHQPETAIELAQSIVVRAVLLIVMIGLVLFLIWLSFFTGIYNPHNYCPVSTFDYPDCSNALMHGDEVALDPPLSFEQWLELRKLFQQALVVDANAAANKAGIISTTPHKSSLADDWSNNNTYGFVDMSAIEFKQYPPPRGRAVVATKFIRKGTKIWDSRYRAVFPNGCVAKLYFEKQTNQQKCDAMFWGYANNFYGNGFQYMLDLDGHGYINHHDTPNAIHHFEFELNKDRYGVSRLWNFPAWGIYPLSKTIWQQRNRPGAYGLYAKQDIQVGDEIVYNYNEIFMYGWLDWFTIFIERSLPIWEWLTI